MTSAGDRDSSALVRRERVRLVEDVAKPGLFNRARTVRREIDANRYVVEFSNLSGEKRRVVLQEGETAYAAFRQADEVLHDAGLVVCSLWRNINVGREHFHAHGPFTTTVRRGSLAGADLAGRVLTGADLTGELLSGANLTGANLSNADLRGSEITDLTDATLVGANLSGMRLRNLRNSDLTDADLTDADLRGALLAGTRLTRTRLGGADLRDVREARLTDARIDARTKQGQSPPPKPVPKPNRDLPCIMCGKIIHIEVGGKGSYRDKRNNKFYARHAGRIPCDGQPGFYPEEVLNARVAAMSPEERRRSQYQGTQP